MGDTINANLTAYSSFNEFFIRKLKSKCRPISSASIVSPVDGTISQMGLIKHNQLLQAKGRQYTVEDLLSCGSQLAQNFYDGQFITLYLSPRDYHRIHMPITATLRNMIYVPGKLFSVQPVTVKYITKLFPRNERLVMLFDSPLGLMAIVMVGALIVGTMGTTWHGDIRKQRQSVHYDCAAKTALFKGDEVGYFKLGSTVILMFANSNSITWLPTITVGRQVNYGNGLVAERSHILSAI